MASVAGRGSLHTSRLVAKVEQCGIYRLEDGLDGLAQRGLDGGCVTMKAYRTVAMSDGDRKSVV